MNDVPEVVPDSGVAIEPKLLDTVMSLRLPSDLAIKLRSFANDQGRTVTGLMREAVERMVGTPIGWKCEHFNITSLPGVLGRPIGWCGCEMAAVYHWSEIKPPGSVMTDDLRTLTGQPMVDVILPVGTHYYWSTHCRHSNHDACRATELAPGVPRRPAQCKTCAAPCRCLCHTTTLPWTAAAMPGAPENPDLWNLLDGPKPGFCCQDAYSSVKRNPDEMLHTSGCPHRCSVFSPIPRAAERGLPEMYPCALTAGHEGKHWIHPGCREHREARRAE
jgi:hypothetical protein